MVVVVAVLVDIILIMTSDLGFQPQP